MDSKYQNLSVKFTLPLPKVNNMEKRWISDFLGIGYRYTDIFMNILILYTERKIALKTWNEYIHWWPDDQIVLRFIEDDDYYWFILYQRGKNLLSKENVGFFKKNPLTDNYLRYKKNYEVKSLLRFALYKSLEKKTIEDEQPEDDGYEYKENKKGNNVTFELDIFKKFKTIYDVKFLKINEVEVGTVEYSLIRSNDTHFA